jgi:hypothetical protein
LVQLNHSNPREKCIKIVLYFVFKFSCVEKCPDDLPHLVEDKDPDKPTMTVCASDDHPAVKARDAKRKEYDFFL